MFPRTGRDLPLSLDGQVKHNTSKTAAAGNGDGGSVTINGGSVTATGNGGAGIGKGKGEEESGTVTFAEGVNFTIKAGSASPGSDTTTDAYKTDHSAKYVSIKAVAPAIGYYLFGDITDWQANAGYKFTGNNGNIGEYVLPDVQLTAEAGNNNIMPGTLDGSKITYYPSDSGENYVVSKSGMYNIYFRPAGDGGDGWWKGVLRIETINDN